MRYNTRLPYHRIHTVLWLRAIVSRDTRDVIQMAGYNGRMAGVEVDACRFTIALL